MAINTANRDIRDIGIAFGVAIGVKIVWGLSLDLIDMAKAKGKKAAPAVLPKDVEQSLDNCKEGLGSISESIDTCNVKLDEMQETLDSVSDILEEGARVQKQAQKVTLQLVTATEEVSAIADAIKEVVTPPMDLNPLAAAASVAVEELKLLLEDAESTAQELTEAQDLCKKSLAAFQEGITLVAQRHGDVVLVDRQYYSNLLDLYRALLPKVKTARATITRKGKGKVK